MSFLLFTVKEKFYEVYKCTMVDSKNNYTIYKG